ncbi:unnamed protein product, partial [Closterium sp. NIES-53]
GRFKYRPNMCRAIGMIAGGTGVTPMFQVGWEWRCCVLGGGDCGYSHVPGGVEMPVQFFSIFRISLPLPPPVPPPHPPLPPPPPPSPSPSPSPPLPLPFTILTPPSLTIPP